MPDFSQIKHLTSRIAQEFKPEKILLFGSYARGNPTPDSDVDLLVILPHKGKNWRFAAQIRGFLGADFPLDLLVRTPEEMRRRLAEGDPFLQEIASTGKVLYETSNS